MDKLNLNFLEKDEHLNLSPLESVLHKVGKEIYDYAKEYFFYLVTASSSISNNINDPVHIEEASLYILAPEIGYNYKILTLSYLDTQTVKISFYTLEIESNQKYEISIKNNWDLVYKKINEILSSKSANAVFRILVDQINESKREG